MESWKKGSRRRAYENLGGKLGGGGGGGGGGGSTIS